MSSIELIAKDFQKDFGEDSITLGTEIPDMDIVSSGSISIDYATGVGGFPRGTFVEILASESVGKTSLSYYGMVEAQKKDLRVLFVNLEGLFDGDWAQQIAGLDKSKTLIASPDPGMDTVQFLQKAVHSGQFGHIVLDSIGAMIDDSEVFNKEGKPGKIQPGGAAALVTSMINRTLSYARRNGTTVVFLNQLRDTMGTLYPTTHGPGGRAIKHAATIRIMMKPTSDKIKTKIDGDDIVVARRISAEIIKNKVGPPNAVGTYMFYNREVGGIGPGIDREGEIVDLALKTGIITKSGSFYSHAALGEKSIQGSDNVKLALKDNPEAFEEIRKAVIQHARKKRKTEE